MTTSLHHLQPREYFGPGYRDGHCDVVAWRARRDGYAPGAGGGDGDLGPADEVVAVFYDLRGVGLREVAAVVFEEPVAAAGGERGEDGLRGSGGCAV